MVAQEVPAARRDALDAARAFLGPLGVADADLAGAAAQLTRTYAGLLTPLPLTVTPTKHDVCDSIVVARNLTFTSLCREHLLPFGGVVHVGFLARRLTV